MSYKPDISNTAETGTISVPPVTPKLKMPTAMAANLCFLLAMILFNLLGVLLVKELNWPSLWLTIVAEIFVIAGLPLLFTLVRKYDFKATFSLKKVSWGTIGLCILIGFATQFAVRFPGAVSQWFLQFFGPLDLPDDTELVGDGVIGVLIFTLATLIIAPICEEILGRGFMLAGYKHTGFLRCLIMVGLFFGLFHQYPYRFVDTALAGLVLGYLVLVSGSLYTSIAAHFGFNLLPNLVFWFREPINKFLQENASDQKVGQGGAVNFSLDTVVSTLPLSLIATAILLVLLRSLTKREALRRPGLIMNYPGFAVDFNESENIRRADPYLSPGAPYFYGAHGFYMGNRGWGIEDREERERRTGDRGWGIGNRESSSVKGDEVISTAENITHNSQPSNSNVENSTLNSQLQTPNSQPLSPYLQPLSPNPYPPSSILHPPLPFPPRKLPQPRAKLASVIFFLLILLTFAYSSLAELNVRINGRNTPEKPVKTVNADFRPAQESLVINSLFTSRGLFVDSLNVAKVAELVHSPLVGEG